jgi:V/A-type H+-transporting ATPase subunit I
MIDRMTKYSFILLSGEEGPLLDQLQGLGLVDITRSEKPVDEASSKLSGEIDLIQGIIQGLKNINLPEGTQPIPCPEEDLIRVAGGAMMRYVDSTARVSSLRKEQEALLHWGEFDTALLQKLADAGIPLHFHTLTPKRFKPEWQEQYALTIVSQDKELVYFVVAGEDDLPGEVPTPERNAEQVAVELQDALREHSTLEGIIAMLKERIPELKTMEKAAYAKLDKYLAGQAAVPAAENTIVTLVGYAPTESDATVTEALEEAGVFYLQDAATVDDQPPIRFKNNKFVKMFEVLTDMYGRPSYDGFDPTPFISVFFLLFFAFCMGDAGYGLVLILIGFLLRKTAKDLAPLVVTLGVGTVVIGFLFHNFFSIDISQWAIFAPIKGVFVPAEIAGNDATMILALAVGILHICLAMVVKSINAVRVRGFAASLGTLGWTLLIVGGVIIAAVSLAGVLDNSVTRWIIIGLGVVSALGIFVFNDPKRNKLANVGMGLWDTYNMITGLMGDVLSYLRLYALGLAGSMLGMAFNDMGNMVLGDGSNVVMWLPFILLVVVGHTLNIAMCALGAFVHPLRLNFLEFFKNSGYEAGGRKFNPLTNNE